MASGRYWMLIELQGATFVADSRVRISAELRWEQQSRVERLWYEVPCQKEGWLNPGIEPFLIPAYVRALVDGEERVKVAEEVSPLLASGLKVAGRTLKQWAEMRGEVRVLPQLEAPVEFTPGREVFDHRVAASLLSGGLDSLSCLRANVLDLPGSHPRRIRAGIFVRGMQPEVDRAWSILQPSLQRIADDAKIELVVVDTNLMVLSPFGDFWDNEYEGAAWAGVGHALSGGISSLTIGSSMSLEAPIPFGTHPLLDIHYGTERLPIFHADITLNRLDKLRLMLDWKVGMEELRVCHLPPTDPGSPVNCGQCEKCLRTMLGLIAVAGRTPLPQFASSVDVRTVLTRLEVDEINVDFYREILDALAGSEHRGLELAVKLAIMRHRARSVCKTAAKGVDSAILRGSIRRRRAERRFRVASSAGR